MHRRADVTAQAVPLFQSPFTEQLSPFASPNYVVQTTARAESKAAAHKSHTVTVSAISVPPEVLTAFSATSPGLAFTWAELEHPTLGVVIHSGLSRAIAGAAAHSGGPVLIPSPHHLDIQHSNALRARRLPYLVGGFFELDGGC